MAYQGLTKLLSVGEGRHVEEGSSFFSGHEVGDDLKIGKGGAVAEGGEGLGIGNAHQIIETQTKL
jgi:hypothetical protein